MKSIQSLVVILIVCFAGWQALKYFSSQDVQSICKRHIAGGSFSAKEFVNDIAKYDIRTAGFSDLAAEVPDPSDISHHVVNLAINLKTLKHGMPAAYDLIDQNGIKGQAYASKKVGPSEFKCTVSFDKGRVTGSLSSW